MSKKCKVEDVDYYDKVVQTFETKIKNYAFVFSENKEWVLDFAAENTYMLTEKLLVKMLKFYPVHERFKRR